MEEERFLGKTVQRLIARQLMQQDIGCVGNQSESIDDNDTFTEEYSNRGSVRDMSWYGRELRGVRQISQIGPTYPGVCGGE